MSEMQVELEDGPEGGNIWRLGNAPSGDNATGRICIVQNPFRRKRDPTRPLFTRCSFNDRGDVLATVDEFGQLRAFRIVGGGYRNLRKLGSRGTALAFSPTISKEVIVGLANRMAVRVDVDTVAGEDYSLKTLSGHSHPIISIAYHPTRLLVATASTERLILWDATKWTRKKSLGGGSGIVQTKFTPRGDLVLVAFRDSSIVGWGAHDFQVLVRLVAKVPLDHPRFFGEASATSCCTLTCFCVSPDSRFALAGGKGPLLFLWELGARALIRVIELPGTVSSVDQVDFVPDSFLVATLADDGIIRIINALGENCKMAQEISNETGAFLSFALTSTKLAGCLSNGTLTLHDLGAAKTHNERIQKMKQVMGRDPALDQNRAFLTTYSSFQPATAPPKTQDVENIPVNQDVVENSQEMHSSPEPSKTTKRRDVQCETETKHGSLNMKMSQVEAETLKDPLVFDDTRAPLVRLAHDLKKDEIDLNEERLGRMLRYFGEFPDTYRNLVWRFLLRLPENSDAYGGLVRKGAHPAWQCLYEKYPVRSHKVFARFERVMFALAHWCPLFEDISYLPAVCFPFVKVYGNDELSAFETVMTVLFRVCTFWFESFPHAPVFVLARIEKLLERTDKHLLNHFTNIGVTNESYAWVLLRSMFSEVLTKGEWLKLWDHVVFYLDKSPHLLEVACVAYLRYFRNTLLSLRRGEDVAAFFRQQNPIDVKRWIKAILRLHKANLGFFENFATGHEKQKATMEFIPKGLSYPSFQHYPKFVVDYEAQERRRIQMEEEDILKRRDLVSSIREKTLELEQIEREHILVQENILRTEEQNRREMALEEERRLEEKKRLDEIARLRRLERVEKLEDLAKDNLTLQQKLRLAEAARVKQELEHKSKVQALELESRKEEERVQKLESEADLRLQKLQAERQLQQEMQSVRLDAARGSKQNELDWKMKQELWRIEDEKRKLDRENKLERLQRETRIREIAQARRELDSKHALQQMETKQKVAQLERERQIRAFVESGAEFSQDELQKRLEEERLVAKEEQMVRDAINSQQEAWAKQAAAEREKLLTEEQRRVIFEAQQRDARLLQIQREQARRHFEEEASVKLREQRQAFEKEERELQRQLLSLDEQRRVDRNLETELLLKEKQLEERTKFMRAAREQEDRAIEKERERFQQLRLELAQHYDTVEKEKIEKFSQSFEADANKQQEELEQLLENARKRIQQEEIAHLAG
eukprot:CAMPEP_0203751130 /NCGR_PEP_ID=MMETSP0098-20131031/5251_1 /ASSEMBLY_ACC=CAM_ASM_000208 /TAXON_ID=96639 /ORGANISM=" , Strain NY0313808BC1" /LENGTH=1221 /DNA_ID=CAMNT_0050640713 /DNA_START=57 /DNA_END=3719 /DNA_ORIENTATION=-